MSFRIKVAELRADGLPTHQQMKVVYADLMKGFSEIVVLAEDAGKDALANNARRRRQGIFAECCRPHVTYYQQLVPLAVELDGCFECFERLS